MAIGTFDARQLFGSKVQGRCGKGVGQSFHMLQKRWIPQLWWWWWWLLLILLRSNCVPVSFQGSRSRITLGDLASTGIIDRRRRSCGHENGSILTINNMVVGKGKYTGFRLVWSTNNSNSSSSSDGSGVGRILRRRRCGKDFDRVITGGTIPTMVVVQRQRLSGCHGYCCCCCCL